jgi:MSHA biogenesis protein MshK
MKHIKHLIQLAHHQLKQLLILIFGVSISLTIGTAQADSLKDPTQPPASIYSNTDTVGGVDASSAPVLQSVMIGPHYRAAIINGKKVLLGRKYEQATLIKLNEHEAVLRNPDMTTQTLVMDYAIEKKIVSPVTTKKVKRSTKPE